MENKYIATFSTGEQITQEDYIKVSPSLEITDSTTVGEIKAWYRKRVKIGAMQISVIELETI